MTLRRQPLLHIALLACSALTVACSAPKAAGTVPTLNGQPPLVIAHRGASGYLTEETLEAYTRAMELGADVIEMDLVATKDGVLITRHDANLGINTDVASRPEFASRKKTVEIDGGRQTGWFSNDFTLAEIRTLGAISTDPARPQQFNGLYKVPTFQQVVDLARDGSRRHGRTVAIYPETKSPAYFRAAGLPLEDKVLAILNAEGWNTPAAPVFVQSFDAASLKTLRAQGLKTRAVQLVGGSAADKAARDVLLSPAGLAGIRAYAEGIGPAKALVLENDADPLVPRAHRAGLFVHPYTFRNEAQHLPAAYGGDPVREYLMYYRAGVDGVFTDFTDTALAARAQLYGPALPR